MNKKILLEQLIVALENVHLNAVIAAARAHETATDNENIAENKYDTLAVEAAYLAHGQSVRVEQCTADIAAFKNLNTTQLSTKVSLGSLVLLLDDKGNEKWLFFGPCAGGLSIMFEGKNIMIVTASSPLGEVLERAEIEQEVGVNIAGKQVNYEVLEIH